MSKRKSILILGLLGFGLMAGAWAQDSTQGSSTPPTGAPQDGTSSSQSQPQQPVPAYGPESAPPPISENPPLSGLDLPALGPHAAPLSYLQPGATVSESVDSNVANSLGESSVRSVTRALGSLTLHRLWSNYDLALDYVGGAAYYDAKGLGWKSMQQMDLDQKVTWKRGQLSVRDSFSYLPEGNFGGAYGSLGSQGISGIGSTAFGSFFGGSSLGALGLAPRVLNVSLADISENLTPKSAITVAGGYAFTHFYGSDFQGESFLGSSQVSVQVGYNRLLNPHTQVALVYGYQAFDFSVSGTAFHSHIIQAMYGHRITGRTDFLIGAGPQFTLIDTQSAVCSDPTVPAFFCLPAGDTLIPVTDKNTKIGVAGRARLRYKFPKTSLDLSYERFETSGSGIFAGAQSDIIRLSADRPLSRVWSATVDIGYAHNTRVQPLSADELSECSLSENCPANDANSYKYGFAGFAVHRAFSRSLHAFASYQFNDLSFDRSFCDGATIACSRISNRHVATIGLDWTPRPMRID